MPDTLTDYYIESLTWLNINELSFISVFIIISACFFFSGIICNEFEEKTAYIIFPKINKYKLLMGKFLGNITLLFGVITIYYISVFTGGYLLYGEKINFQIISSYRFELIFAIAISSFITFFSSITRNVNVTIISSIILLTLVLTIIDIIFMASSLKLEPLYSLVYPSQLIEYLIHKKFPDPRYEEEDYGDYVSRHWLTPTIMTGTIVLLIYTIVCLFVALFIFHKKQV
jgi:ABC-type transport system involved in multi-copper enzyme maturation permease subunit